VKFDSKTYVIHYKKGKIIEEGLGLAFYASTRKSSIEAVPVGSKDIPFIFTESTSDFQTVTVQGQITYKVDDPKKLASVMDFTVDFYGDYKTNDSEKLEQRLINEAQTASTSLIQTMELRQAITNAKNIQQKIFEGLTQSDTVNSLGIRIMAINIIAIKPTPEMAKALETTTREKLQQEADQAIYERRNFAVEQERIIKESVLNTEIAMQEKQKQIAEKRMERERLEKENKKTLRLLEVNADIEVEKQKQQLIDIQIENDKKLADSEKYSIAAKLEPYKNMDWRILSSIVPKSAKNEIAMAFRHLAENAENIKNLNISPNLLQSLLSQESEYPDIQQHQ